MPRDRFSPPPGRLLVVLGGTNGPSGRLSAMCVRRLRRALELYRATPERSSVSFVVTGGHGDHFNLTRRPHWWYGRRWLLRHGVPASQIRLALASGNTPEDAQLLAHALRGVRPGSLDLVTSDFHLRRARVLFAHFLPGWKVRPHRSACLREFKPERQKQLRAHESRRVRSYLSEGFPKLPATKLSGRIAVLR